VCFELPLISKETVTWSESEAFTSSAVIFIATGDEKPAAEAARITFLRVNLCSLRLFRALGESKFSRLILFYLGGA
jgi:hypothetical protein